jgi:glycerate dehydrogenase
MRAVFLDLATLGATDLDINPLYTSLTQLDCYELTTPEQVLPRLAEARLVIVNKVKLDRRILSQLPRLKHVIVAATGVNNVDLEAAAQLGISVQNCRAYGVESVAQHCLMLMLTLSTKLLQYRQALAQGDWSRSPHFCMLDYPVENLSGKTLGIVGYGELGRGVAQLAQAFGMNIMIASRPNQAIQDNRVSLQDMLPQVDILSLHCPLTPATKNLIDWPQLCALPRSALVINCARGGIVNEDALLRALEEGQIAGAGVDVLTQEPPAIDHPLLVADNPNLIVTPHTAWSSRSARQAIVQQIVENITSINMASDLLRQV